MMNKRWLYWSNTEMARQDSYWLLGLLLFLAGGPVLNRVSAAEIPAFIERHCVECHDGDSRRGDLDLTALPLKSERTVHLRPLGEGA